MADSALSVPLLMRGALDWKPLAWEEDDWVAAFMKDNIKVRIGEKNPEYLHPQWERFTKVCGKLIFLYYIIIYSIFPQCRYKRCQLKQCSMKN